MILLAAPALVVTFPSSVTPEDPVLTWTNFLKNYTIPTIHSVAVSFFGDAYHKDRCTHLRNSWQNLNRGQGLGFVVFHTVIDRAKLGQIAAQLLGVSGTVIMALYSFGHDNLVTPGSAVRP